MRLPPGVNKGDFEAALRAFRDAIGADWVFTRDEDLDLYRDAYSAAWGEPEEKIASAALAPDTVEQVQAIVRIANRYRIPIYSISTGRNLGYGGSAPNLSGSVVVDLKRMNRIIEVDDRRNFCIVEPGVSYFDLYEHVEARKLNVIVDVPDPGWGSLVGNALDHGRGYMMPMYRCHWSAHSGMEVVLPNGELMRTGMGALPGAQTFAEYQLGFGPVVDGLFSQSNFGIVTKMGFWMMPKPEHFFSAMVTIPKYMDVVPFIDILNYLEDSGVIGHPRWGTPLWPASPQDSELRALHAKPGGASPAEYEVYAAKKGVGFFNVTLNYYGSRDMVAANWAFSKKRFSEIKGVSFKELESYALPMDPDQIENMAHKVALGVPNLSIFNVGTRSPASPKPQDGLAWFAAVLPRNGESLIKAQEVFAKVFRDNGWASPIGPYSTPRTWIYRANVLLTPFFVSRTDKAQNQRVRDLYPRLVEAAAQHGWGEYRAAPLFQDAVAKTYSFNNNMLMRFNQTLKDTLDPNGILSAGRGGIWPKHLRGGKSK